ncbi:MAG: beta-N-acetylhexosaminidase [Gemmatimonadales bacterium]
MRNVRTTRAVVAVGVLSGLLACRSVGDDAGPALLPRAATVSTAGSAFRLDQAVAVVAAPGDSAAAVTAGFVRDALAPLAAASAGSRVIRLSVVPGGTREGYSIRVTADTVAIEGADADGLFWGVQSLRQLLPPAFEDSAARVAGRWTIPAVAITDAPRFAWRGVLLDAGRHFFPVADIKRLIDVAARYKLNIFHWHLTEDQGWRIAIDKYPRLTSVGAWRTEADGTRYGGFYTKDEVRDIVAFARARHVIVVPEIEMPGHSTAAIAAYPWLGCTGRPVEVATQWGVHPEIYCAGNERVFGFLEDVLDEVVPLFPGPWFHIGGDEAPKDRWRDCPACQARIRAEGLADEEELQRWFTGRIGGLLAARGRTLVGWDEIMDGGSVPGAVIQAWRGGDRVRMAVRAGHQVVASPGVAYINSPPDQLSLERVYGFRPVPDSLEADQAELVIGGEATLWSEHITPANLDPMAFPRLLALAEVLWSGPGGDYAGFAGRLAGDHEARLEALGVRVGPRDGPIARIAVRSDSASGSVVIDTTTAMAGVSFRVTPAPLPDSGTVSVAAVLDGRELPGARRFALVSHLARGRPIRFETPPDSRYPGTGPGNLVDALLASDDLRDGLWQGWWGPDLVATVDLGRVGPVASVEISFLEDVRSWIMLPRRIEVRGAADSGAWRPLGSFASERPASPTTVAKQTFRIRFDGPSMIRYVEVRAVPGGPLPPGHPGAGQPAWIFADEIVVH